MGHRRRYTLLSLLNKIVNRKTRRRLSRVFDLGQLLQLGLLFVIFLLVLQSHSRASLTTEQLQLFKEEESMLLLQLQKIEKQSILLHENIRTRMKRAGIDGEDLTLGEQTSELYEMTQEINEQVESVQSTILESCRDHIISEYGEGPLKVVLELEFLKDKQPARLKAKNLSYSKFFHAEDDTSHVTILLWPETPHAAWTWLEQIGRHVWDGSLFQWSSNEPLLQLAPKRDDPLSRGSLQFQEFHDTPHWHSAWSVGVRNADDGGLQMFLNLQDNVESQDTCIGRIVDGYDALQRIFEATDTNGELSAVMVKRVTAMHMTHRELANIEY